MDVFSLDTACHGLVLCGIPRIFIYLFFVMDLTGNKSPDFCELIHGNLSLLYTVTIDYLPKYK